MELILAGLGMAAAVALWRDRPLTKPFAVTSDWLIYPWRMLFPADVAALYPVSDDEADRLNRAAREVSARGDIDEPPPGCCGNGGAA